MYLRAIQKQVKNVLFQGEVKPFLNLFEI